MHAWHPLRTGATALALAAALITAGGADAGAASTDWQVSLSGDSPMGSVMSVSAVDGQLAWAGGRKDGHGVIMRWDGQEWNTDPAPGLPDVWQWSSVSAVSADDVWAYGSSGGGQSLAHYDGERWTVVPTAGPFDSSWPQVPLKAVPGRLFKGGESLYTYADGGWQSFVLPSLVDIHGIDARSADDAYAVGMQYPVDGGHPVVYHWDGTTWTLLPQPEVPAGTDVGKVVEESPNSVYVAGWAQGQHAGPAVPNVEHWDGTAWTDVTGSLAGLVLEGISTDGAGGLWAGGMDDSQPADAGPVMWHYDGTTWTEQPAATAPDGDTQWPSYTFHDLAPADTTGAVWAVGDYSMPLDESGDQPVNGLIERSAVAARP